MSHARARSRSATGSRRVPIRKFRFVARDHTQFGNASPKWTIPSSRCEPRPPDPIPAPGHYVIRDDPPPPKLPHLISVRPEPDYRTVTSDLDFGVRKQFPRVRPLTIGRRDRLCYTDLEPTPEPTWAPRGTGRKGKFSVPHIKISEFFPEHVPDRVPSPSRYDPIDPRVAFSKGWSLPRAKRKPLGVPSDVPGPGTYETMKPVKSYTRWAEKLMTHSHRWREPQDSNGKLWRVQPTAH